MTIKFYRKIHLTDLLDTMEIIKGNHKTNVIIEEENSAYRFFKYKGNLFDFSESILKE